MRLLVLTLCFITGMIGFASAGEKISGPIKADVESVYDGDTITASAHIWIGQTINTKVRIRGIDTPELRGKCDTEKQQAIKAKDFVQNLIGNKPVTLTNIENGKYAGRVIADVFVDDVNVSEAIINNGLGRIYDGGKRKGWCD